MDLILPQNQFWRILPQNHEDFSKPDELSSIHSNKTM